MKKLFLIASLILIATSLINCTSSPNSAKQNTSNVDTTKVDTAVVDTTTVDTATTSTLANDDEKAEVNEKLKILKPFDTDKSTFDKIYAKARKKGDDFSSSMIISDPSSPAYVNRNGIYCEVQKTNDDVTLNLNIQYYAEDWLFINNMIFNLDGQNFDYTPGDFKRDNSDGKIWEWSEEEVRDFDLVAKIALAKNAKVKYNGSEYYKIVKITPTQQKAMKNMLVIYNGLLKGYKK